MLNDDDITSKRNENKNNHGIILESEINEKELEELKLKLARAETIYVDCDSVGRNFAKIYSLTMLLPCLLVYSSNIECNISLRGSNTRQLNRLLSNVKSFYNQPQKMTWSDYIYDVNTKNEENYHFEDIMKKRYGAVRLFNILKKRNMSIVCKKNRHIYSLLKENIPQNAQDFASDKSSKFDNILDGISLLCNYEKNNGSPPKLVSSSSLVIQSIEISVDEKVVILKFIDDDDINTRYINVSYLSHLSSEYSFLPIMKDMIGDCLNLDNRIKVKKFIGTSCKDPYVDFVHMILNSIKQILNLKYDCEIKMSAERDNDKVFINYYFEKKDVEQKKKSMRDVEGDDVNKKRKKKKHE